MPFTSALRVTMKTGKVGAVLDAPLHYQYGDIEIIVPKGFDTDFASVPGDIILPGLVPKVGRLAAAAVVHDWLYRVCGDQSGYHFDRKECDKIFRLAMDDLNVYWWRRWIAWAGVRVGGLRIWNRRCKDYIA